MPKKSSKPLMIKKIGNSYFIRIPKKQADQLKNSRYYFINKKNGDIYYVNGSLEKH